jgi:ketosteroid isomerase-like protein
MSANISAGDRFRELADRREIDDVLYRYAQSLDSHDWDRLRTCFTADAVADFLELGGRHEGIDAIVGLISSVLSGLDASQHLIGSPIAEVDGDTAKSTCYLQAQHVFEGAPGGDHYLVGGTYVDELVRTAEGWRIARRTLHGTWFDGNPEVFTAAAERMEASKA